MEQQTYTAVVASTMLSGKERKQFSLVLLFLFIPYMACFSPLFSPLLGFSFRLQNLYDSSIIFFLYIFFFLLQVGMAACQVEVFDLHTQFWDRFYERLLFSAGTGAKWHVWNTACKDIVKMLSSQGTDPINWSITLCVILTLLNWFSVKPNQ